MKKITALFLVMAFALSTCVLAGVRLIGDVNDDGESNNKDVFELFKYASNDVTADDETLYDFDGNGEINNKDVVSLFKFVSSEKNDYSIPDTDNDGLNDEVEAQIGTDKLKADTDGDGLSDYQEIVLGTDPLTPNEYSADLDSDNDGITDMDEASVYNTDPSVADSDGDGLSDYEEIFIFNTDPNKADTDGDTLNDRFELEHGLDPNKVSTDGVRNDADISFEQNISADNISAELTAEENVAVPTISGNTSGDLSDNVFISQSTDNSAGDNRSLVGKVVDVNTSEGYDVEGLTLSFDMSKYQTSGGDMQSLTICKINSEGNFEIVESSVSGDEISCTMDSDGSYCVLDANEFLTQFGIDLSDVSVSDHSIKGKRDYRIADNSGSAVSGQADIVFVIDTTGSMSDEIYAVEQNVVYFAEKLKSDYNVMVNYALIDYKDLEEDGYNTTKVIKYGASNWFSSTSAFAEKVNSMYATGGGDEPECTVDALETARQLDYRYGAYKFIILITDADYKVLNRYGIESLEHEAALLKQDGIITSVVTSSYLQYTYQPLIEETNGIYADIYSNFGDVLLQLADMIGEYTASDNWVILKHGYTYIELPEDSDGDYDDDGLSDVYELGEIETIDLTPFIRFSLAAKGIPYEYYAGKTSIEVYNAYSNPIKPDTDDDGIPDLDDTAPWARGLAGGIVGALKICSYETGPSSSGGFSGHAFIAYTSFINDSLDLYGVLVDSPEKIAKEDDDCYDFPAFHTVDMPAGSVITIGSWAEWLPGFLKGTWINNELMYLDGKAEEDQRSLVYYVTYSDVQKFTGITYSNSRWTSMYNCAAYAAEFWNEITGDCLSASGTLQFNNPASLCSDIEKRVGYVIGGELISYLPYID